MVAPASKNEQRKGFGMSSGPSPRQFCLSRRNTGPAVQPLDATRHGDVTRESGRSCALESLGRTPPWTRFSSSTRHFLWACLRRPVGNLLFLAPTGSGKTYVIEVLAEALFGNIHTPSSKWIAENFRNITKSPN